MTSIFYNFATVDNDYIEYLQYSERLRRGFTRVPDMLYPSDHKSKFVLGALMPIESFCYVVPVSSATTGIPNDIVICDSYNNPTASLRFNYMFPVPYSCLHYYDFKSLADIGDTAYYSLLCYEWHFCKNNKSDIMSYANDTYEDVSSGYNERLCKISCDFDLLEYACNFYIYQHEKHINSQLYN